MGRTLTPCFYNSVIGCGSTFQNGILGRTPRLQSRRYDSCAAIRATRNVREIARTLNGAGFAFPPAPLYLRGKTQYCAESRSAGSAVPELLTRHSEVTAVRVGPTISNSREKFNPRVSVSDKAATICGGGRLVDTILKAGRERQRLMESLRDVLLHGDEAEALERARALTGLLTERSVTTCVSTQAGS